MKNSFKANQIKSGNKFVVRHKPSPLWNDLFENGNTGIIYVSDAVNDDCLVRDKPVEVTQGEELEVTNVIRTETKAFIFEIDIRGTSYYMYAYETKGLFALSE